VIKLEKSNIIIVPEVGLVAYYKFNGNVLDYSGNYNDGKYYGRKSYTLGKLNDPSGAIDLNGSGDYVEVPNSTSLNPTKQLTINLWLRIDSFPKQYTPVVAKGGPYAVDFTNREYLIYFNYDGNIFIESSGDNKSHIYDGAAFPGLKTWFMFTAIVDRVNHFMQVYINGVFKYQIVDTYSTFTINSYPMKIGSWDETDSSYAPYFKGAIDELKMYNKVLSQAEIVSLYQQK
jgi:hypothetical protein